MNNWISYNQENILKNWSWRLWNIFLIKRSKYKIYVDKNVKILI